MTDNIKYILEQNIALLSKLDKAIYYGRRQLHDIALGIVADSMGSIRYTIEAIITDREYFNLVSTDSVLEMLSSILDAYKTEDYILLIDLLELQLVNFLCGVQELIIGREELAFDEERFEENLKLLKSNGSGLEKLSGQAFDPQVLLNEGFRVEFTSSGLMTLAAKNEDASFYFHTNASIPSEAFILANNWYRKDVKRYNIYGLGFGYHILELLSLSDQYEIMVYEADLKVIMLACAFTDLKDIFDNPRVRLIYDPDFNKLIHMLESLSEDEAFYVHYPSYQNIRNEEGRRLLETYVSWPSSHLSDNKI